MALSAHPQNICVPINLMGVPFDSKGMPIFILFSCWDQFYVIYLSQRECEIAFHAEFTLRASTHRQDVELQEVVFSTYCRLFF